MDQHFLTISFQSRICKKEKKNELSHISFQILYNILIEISVIFIKKNINISSQQRQYLKFYDLTGLIYIYVQELKKISWSFELSHELSELKNQTQNYRTRNESSILKIQLTYLYIETSIIYKPLLKILNIPTLRIYNNYFQHNSSRNMELQPH